MTENRDLKQDSARLRAFIDLLYFEKKIEFKTYEALQQLANSFDFVIVKLQNYESCQKDKISYSYEERIMWDNGDWEEDEEGLII